MLARSYYREEPTKVADAEMAATISSLPHAVMSASALLSIGVGLGALLEYLASHRVLGLHRVPLGPGGADITLASIGSAGLPAPYGHHGWLPVPLASSTWRCCGMPRPSGTPRRGGPHVAGLCGDSSLPPPVVPRCCRRARRVAAMDAMAVLRAAVRARGAPRRPCRPRHPSSGPTPCPCCLARGRRRRARRAALRRSGAVPAPPRVLRGTCGDGAAEAYDGCTTLSDQLAREPDAVLGALAPSLACPIHSACADDGSLMLRGGEDVSSAEPAHVRARACSSLLRRFAPPRDGRPDSAGHDERGATLHASARRMPRHLHRNRHATRCQRGQGTCERGQGGQDGSPPPLWGAAD